MFKQQSMRISVSILVWGAAPLAAACNVQVEPRGDTAMVVGSSGSGPTCAPDGAKCTSGSGCCSQGCPNGACGMASGSGACKPGDAPVVLASTHGHALALAIDATWVYYTKSLGTTTCGESLVMRVPKIGGTPEVFGNPNQAVVALAVDEMGVYWSDNPDYACAFPDGAGYTMFRSPKTMGESTTFPFTQDTAVREIALDATHVYWVSWGHGPIWRAPKTGGDAELVFNRGGAITVDATSIYWTWGGPNGDNVMGMAKEGGDTTELNYIPASYTGGAASYGGITNDADSVYFIQSISCMWPEDKTCISRNEVRRVSKVGTEETGTLATFFDMWPGEIAVDQENVYWTGQWFEASDKLGEVLRVKKTGGEAQVIASSPVPYDIAVDETCVYWTDFSTGEVWKGPK